MKTLRYFTILLATLICGCIFAQETQKELEQISKNHGEYYFSLNIEKPTDFQALSTLCSIDDLKGKTVVCYANQEQYENLLKQGYQPTLMMPPSLQFKVEMWDGSNRAAYDWDAYPTYEAYESMMYQFGTDHPDKCEIITLGTLPSGRKILIARLNNGAPEGKPKFLYTSTIHGDETTGWIMMLRLIDYLLENPNEPEVQAVMDNIDLYVGPNTNPDGTYHGGNNTVNGARRENANNVDMNRNYPDRVDGPHPDNHEYQQETQWFMQFAEENAFVMGANYHGGSEVMNYPWDNDYTLHADDAWYQLISREYADDCHKVNPNYMTYLNNGITNGAQWYRIGGGRQDYMNAYRQCRELTIECSNTKLVPGPQLPNFWNYNKEGIFDFMMQCLYGIHGVVTDATTGEPLEATITISGHDQDYSVVESHLPAGDFHRPIKGDTWNVIVRKDGYCPQIIDVTVADYETVNLEVALEPGSCLVAEFSASTTQVSLGQSINFNDGSFGEITSWSWEFEGATPSTSTQQNPTGITYNETGDFSVSLTIADAEGNSQTLTRDNYIHVREAYNMQNGTITTCSALFFDSGGASNAYGNNENYTLTFQPNSDERKINVTFTEFSLESGYDYLYVYDGNSTDSPEIGRYSGGSIPGPFEATNEGGVLTFHFTSDGGVTSPGWVANVSCIGGYDPMIINVTAEPMEINEGESSQLEAIVMGGAGNYTYQWEPLETLDDPTNCCPIATPVDAETTYKVTVTDAEGNTISGEVTVTIRDWSLFEDGFLPNIYPNPTKDSFTINMRGKYSYTLYNTVGQQILSGKAEGKAQIEALLAPGVYFLQMIGENGIGTEKLVIE
ncbi:MAG: DUF2817 domain-containing protein [Bacteroidales bacterium]|nr:DUF2817 domain-containing protein [Bacteroidales bacterium]